MRPIQVRSTTQSGENTIAMLARDYVPGSRTGVIVTHGAGVLASAFLPGGQYWVPVANLASSGYPCLCVDAGGLTTFGNDASLAAITADVSVLQAAPYSAKAGKVFIHGGSMGALEALNWARANPTLVAGMLLTIPAGDLNDIYTNNKGGFQANIGTAYGVSYPTAIPGLATHNPQAFSGADLAALASIPIQFYTADDDPIAWTTAAARAWAATVGPNCKVTSMGAVGHSAASLHPQIVEKWFNGLGIP